MDIVKEMRGFEVDHEPEGWPAIRMSQVSALCDEIDALRAELQKAREQEPVIQIENGIVVNFNPNYDGDVSNGEFYAAPVPEMPIPKQEPVGKVRKVAHGGPHAFQMYDNLPIGESEVYLSAQQPAQAAPEGYTLAPVEPTASMLDAGVAMALQVSVHGEGGWSKYLCGLYKQMLSASPSPQQSNK